MGGSTWLPARVAARSHHGPGEFSVVVGVAALVSVLATTAVGIVPARAAAYDAANDPWSMYATTTQMGARDWWRQGYTGKGVDVALIDTGVAPVAGLTAAGKVVQGPDLSFESQSSTLRHLDTFGHGTFMAGLIAGNDAPGSATESAASVYRGVAPDARIVSLKVGVADGGTDVSQVIAAIDWVVQHRRDNGLNIRVLNLSYGTNSSQSYAVDPLAFAVEQAWKAGIVVVAAAGNSGFQNANHAVGLADPAYDPNIIAVGGYDTAGTAITRDDNVGDYSAATVGCGLSCRNPDFVAIGSHVQGLRAPGSFIDTTYPEGRVGDRFFRGSGTSQAAAVTSGAVALLLQKHPWMTPDKVKAVLASTGQPVYGYPVRAQGAGEIALAGLAGGLPDVTIANPANGTGTGSLEIARGTDHVALDGVDLTGEQDIFGKPFNSAAMATLEAQGRSWSGGTWNGSAWTADNWTTGATTGSLSWSGRSWSGRSWSGRSWSDYSWSGRSWSGRSWRGRSWSGGSWG